MNAALGWRFAAASVPGSGHLAADRGCDDAFLCEIVGMAGGRKVLVAAAADGAGSAQLGAVGSRIACQSIIEQSRHWLAGHSNLRDLPESCARSWLDGIRESIGSEAGDRGCDMRDLATTLLFAIVDDQEAVFWQVGDGAIVVSDVEGEWAWVSWPQHGLHASETYFVTDPGAYDMICFSMARQPIREIALFTDGLERLLLDHAAKVVQEAAFEKMFHPLRASTADGEDNALSQSLDRYLRSPAVSNRTDDDVTLIIASRSTSPPDH